MLCWLAELGWAGWARAAGLGMAIGAILWASLGDGSVPDFSVYALPSAAYGVLMYFVAAPFVLWRFFANR